MCFLSSYGAGNHISPNRKKEILFKKKQTKKGGVNCFTLTPKDILVLISLWAIDAVSILVLYFFSYTVSVGAGPSY